MEQQEYKRNIAYKFKIGMLSAGKQIFEGEKMKFLEINNKNVARVNLVANVIDRFIQEGERKFGSITLDDASGQIKAKVFGDDIDKFASLELGDTLLVIGMLRSWNDELYMTPEIIKKLEPEYLLLRKMEVEKEHPAPINSEQSADLKAKVLEMIKLSEPEQGVDVEKIILELKESPDSINAEIKRLLEEGLIYEPRPGRLRYLG
jgi:RPA family protein